MQLSNFLVIFALNLHNFCQCLPANSDRITDNENEEIKESVYEDEDRLLSKFEAVRVIINVRHVCDTLQIKQKVLK